MTSGWKGSIARKASRFFDYWLAADMKKRLGIDQSVIISPGAVIDAGVAIGKRSFVGRRSLINSGRIGAFTSIADHCVVGAGEHPLTAVTTHMEWHVRMHGRDWDNPKPPPVIGSDVWIGTGVTVLRGAVIEDGAVIGAGAVVNGHIPAFAVAVGIPAKVIRYRFDEDVRKRLRQTNWWDWEDDRIEQAYPLFHDVEQFLAYVRKEEGDDAEAPIAAAGRQSITIF